MNTNESSFFLPGCCDDLAYRNIRDLEHHEPARVFIDSLWSRYTPYADRHFLKDAKAHFLERFWEMYLGVTLLEHGLGLVRSGNMGPEFYCAHNNRKVWVEAVAPGPGTGEDRVPETRRGEVFSVPTEKILLRFTNALTEKRRRYLAAVSKGIIDKHDLYVLAVNSRRIPHAPYGNTLPFFLQALLPFGNLAAIIDVKTREITDSFYQVREAIQKARGVSIGTKAFLDPQFGFISAVLHSAVDCVNRPQLMGADFSVLHNPSAANSLHQGIFDWCEQMFYRDGVLERTHGTA